MKSIVKIYIQDYRRIEERNIMPLQANWDLVRKLEREYETDLEGQDAANQAFKVFNKEGLNSKERIILGDYNAPSMSVGDIVEVYPIDPDSPNIPTAYLCASIGWQEKSIPPLENEKKKVSIENYRGVKKSKGSEGPQVEI
jgi:hypothetical protein